MFNNVGSQILKFVFCISFPNISSLLLKLGIFSLNAIMFLLCGILLIIIGHLKFKNLPSSSGGSAKFSFLFFSFYFKSISIPEQWAFPSSVDTKKKRNVKSKCMFLLRLRGQYLSMFWTVHFICSCVHLLFQGSQF